MIGSTDVVGVTFPIGVIKTERASALTELKRICKELGFTAGMLKSSLAEGRKKS